MLGVPPGLEPCDLTLTTAALPRTMVWAGSGETMAFWRYMVEATLARARLGAMLVRPAVLCDAIESRKSGRKKCWSVLAYGLLMADVPGDIAGMGGTGGTSRSGEPGPERLVTPGM